MARKKRTNNSSQFNRAIKIIAGSAITICLFFIAVSSIDIFVRNNTKKGSSATVPLFDEKKEQEKEQGLQQAQYSSNSDPTFFVTLFQKTKDELIKNIKEKESSFKAGSSDGNTVLSQVQKNRTERASTENVISKVKYKIQLASFQDLDGARIFSEQLQAKGYKPYILEVKLEGKGSMYRVRIGEFNSLEEAQKIAKEIERKENLTVLITTR